MKLFHSRGLAASMLSALCIGALSGLFVPDALAQPKAVESHSPSSRAKPSAIPRAGAAGTAASVTAGDDPAIEQVRAAITDWTKGQLKIDEVRRTPIPGIYEARSGMEFLYVDQTGRYAFIEGDLIDIRAVRNLTRERADELLTIDFKTLPLNLALKQVKGNGRRVIAIFEDPNCSYCRHMRNDLNALDDITIYTFAVTMLAADSEIKARKALCAPDKVAAWTKMMLTGEVPDNPGTCANTRIDEMKALNAKLHVNETPTVFFPTGKRLRGYLPPSGFERMLKENASAS